MNDSDHSGPSRRMGAYRAGLAVELWDHPEASEFNLLVGWRQWADAGSVSSGLPKYLVQRLNARQIGMIQPDGFYLFQIPGTHDLLRPAARLDEGFPESLEINRNEIYFTGDKRRGLIILIGDEPHMDVERYSAAVLHLARTFNVRRTVCLGGVYGELPYDRERPVHGVVSMPALRSVLQRMAVTPSEYHGGASIGTYLCKRAGDTGQAMIGLYAFVPAYDFSAVAPQGGVVRVENDFMAWLGIMRRLNYLYGLAVDLTDLEQRSRQLHDAMDEKMSEIDRNAPQLSVREYLQRLAEEFEEQPFLPDDEFWEEKLNGLFDEEE